MLHIGKNQVKALLFLRNNKDSAYDLQSLVLETFGEFEAYNPAFLHTLKGSLWQMHKRGLIICAAGDTYKISDKGRTVHYRTIDRVYDNTSRGTREQVVLANRKLKKRYNKLLDELRHFIRLDSPVYPDMLVSILEDLNEKTH